MEKIKSVFGRKYSKLSLDFIRIEIVNLEIVLLLVE